MPSHSLYKQMMNMRGNTNGQIRANQSASIVDMTWNEDLQSRKCFIYDYFHDDERRKNNKLNSVNSRTKTPIDAKFIVSGYNTFDKDTVPYKIQFRPFQENPLDYFEEYERKYGVQFPIGLYIDIPNRKGIYQRWLICGNGNEFEESQTWFIMPCDYLYQWIHTVNGEILKYEMWGVSRGQSSYNNGVWMDRVIETMENQSKALFPYNSVSQTLFYNKRLIISAPVDEGVQPIAWRVTKVQNTNPKGIQRLTFAQDNYDNSHDYIERDENGFVIGMWADYYSSTIKPTAPDERKIVLSNVRNEITFNGLKPQIKIGGSPKILTAKYYDSSNVIQTDYIGEWYFEIDGIDVRELSDKPLEISTYLYDDSLTENQVRIKFVGGDKYIGSKLTVYNQYDNTIKTNIELAIVAL